LSKTESIIVRGFLLANLVISIGVSFSGLKEIGFTYVTVDIDGYRQGAMNEAIGWKKRK
jgi:PP-loop superfamily ATP-utilizing enzyme